MNDIQWSYFDGTLPEPEGDALSFDVETDYYTSGKLSNNITQIAVANASYGVVARGQDGIAEVIDMLRWYATKHDTVLVGHNAWYADVPWCRQIDPKFPWNEGETMALGYLQDETQSLSLKALCMKNLGVADWKEGLHADQNSDEFAEYNARDAVYTMQLYIFLQNHLGKRADICKYIILPGMCALDACSKRGIYLDKGAIEDARQYYTDKISTCLTRLQSEFGIDNPRRRQLVGESLLADGHRLGRTDKGKLSTSKATISKLKPTALTELLSEYWQLDKAHSAYVVRYGKLSEQGDGRSHAPYTIIRNDAATGTVTGRTSSPDQQLPREDRIRNFFGAPSGFSLISADYSAIEFRVAAWVAGEQGIIDRYAANPGFDPHRWVASLLYGIPESEVTKEQRQIAKSANFGLLYMAQPNTLREYMIKTIGIDPGEAEAKRIYQFWHTTNPMFAPWYSRTWEQIKTRGFAESATGRRRHFGEPRAILRSPRWKRQMFLREGVNFQVQSLAADIALLGLSACETAGLPINWFVHDSVGFEFETKFYEENKGFVQKCISNCMIDQPIQVLHDKFSVDFNMPLRIEIK